MKRMFGRLACTRLVSTNRDNSDFMLMVETVEFDACAMVASQLMTGRQFRYAIYELEVVDH